MPKSNHGLAPYSSSIRWAMIASTSGTPETVPEGASAAPGADSRAAALDLVGDLGSIYDEIELAPWFLTADAFVYPENIGLSILHAFGYGLPVRVIAWWRSGLPSSLRQPFPRCAHDSSRCALPLLHAAVKRLGAVAMGDASVTAAKSAGGITKVAHVDHDNFGVLGIYAKTCTIVTGE